MAGSIDEALRSPSVWRPRSVGEAARLKAACGPNAVFAAGATLLRTQWESGAAAMPDHLIDLTSIPGLDGVGAKDGELIVGALVPLGACRAHPLLASGAPLLAEAIRHIAAASVRNLGTLGGNVAGKVGDAIPALLALGAGLTWHDGHRAARTSLEEWLASSPDAAPGILTAVRLPLPGEPASPNARRWHAFHKTGRRETFVPSLVTAAVVADSLGDGRLANVRIAAGGGQTVPRRLPGAEAAVEGWRPDERTLRAVYEAVLEQYDPVSDPFASSEYRKRTAANWIVTELWKRYCGRESGAEGGEPACC